MEESRQEFELGDNSTTGTDVAPVVVVQYRRSYLSRLTAPLLLLITALALLSQRMKLDDWRGLTGLRADAEPAPVSLTPPKPFPTLALPSPDPIQPESPPGLRPADLPVPISSRPISLPLNSRLIPMPGEDATTAEAIESIRAESELAKAEAASMQEIKDRTARDLRMRADNPPVGIAFGVPIETDTDRGIFHQKLRRILKESSGKSTSAIEELCASTGGIVLTERPIPGTLSTPPPTSRARKDRIEGMRARGIAESVILSDLVRQESKNRAARSGPKSRQEVLIRAAKQLVAIPPRSIARGE